MRKRVALLSAFILIFILIVVGLTPWVHGILFKRNYVNFIQIINQENIAKIEILEYNLGWLTSHAKIRILPVLPKNSQHASLPMNMVMMYNLVLDENISHGPFVYDKIQNKYSIALGSIQSAFHFPTIETMVFGQEKAEGLIQINTLSTYDGTWKNQIMIPSLTSMKPGIGKVTWQGLNGNFTITVKDNLIKTMESHLTMGALLIESENPIVPQVNLQAITYDNNMIRQPLDLWTGNTTISLPFISLTQQEGPSFTMQKAMLTSSVGINANMYFGKADASVQTFEMQNIDLPPISPFTFSLSINNLSAQGLANYIQYIKSKPNFFKDDMKNVESLMTKVFTPTSNLNGVISLNTALGASTDTIKISFKTNSPSPTSLNDLMMNLIFEMDMRTAAPLLEKWLEIYIQKHTPPQSPSQVSAPVTEYIDSFKQQVAELLREGRISLPISLQLIDFDDQNLSAPAFSEKIGSLGLPPDVSDILNKQYQTKLATQTTPATKPVSLTNAEKAQMMINAWIQQGFIVRDGNDYLIKINVVDGVMQINGSVKQLPTIDLKQSSQ